MYCIRNGYLCRTGIYQAEEAGSVAEIEDKINLLEQQERTTAGDSEDTRSVKEKFSGAVVIGDSVAQGFSEYDILNTSSVVSKIGVHLYEADELVTRARLLVREQSFSPWGEMIWQPQRGMWMSLYPSIQMCWIRSRTICRMQMYLSTLSFGTGQRDRG